MEIINDFIDKVFNHKFLKSMTYVSPNRNHFVYDNRDIILYFTSFKLFMTRWFYDENIYKFDESYKWYRDQVEILDLFLQLYINQENGLINSFKKIDIDSNMIT